MKSKNLSVTITGLEGYSCSVDKKQIQRVPSSSIDAAPARPTNRPHVVAGGSPPPLTHCYNYSGVESHLLRLPSQESVGRDRRPLLIDRDDNTWR